MNYDQPREHRDGGWHYTSHNRRIGTYPIGYCRDHGPHPTEDEARRCYRDYELNEQLRLDGTIGHFNPCQAPAGCPQLTNREAIIGGIGPSWLLCDEHRTKEVVAQLYGELAGDSVHS